MRSVKKYSMHILPMATALFVAFMMSCSSEECTDNKNALPLAAFYSSDSVSVKISLQDISVYGLDNPYDSLLADSVSSLDQIYLPFRIDEGKTTFVFDYGTLPMSLYPLRDTLTFLYDIRPEFVSSACGAVYFYENIRVEHTGEYIDSVVVPSGRITNKNSQNIFIYFRDQTEEE